MPTTGGQLNGREGIYTLIEETAQPVNGTDTRTDAQTHEIATNGATPLNGHAPFEDTDAAVNGAQNGHERLSDVLSAWSLVSYGHVQCWGRLSPSSEPSPGPGGELHPPFEYWLRTYLKTPPDQRALIVGRAAAELHSWQRRDPELNAVKTETLEDLKRRIIDDGEGWAAKDVALAMRVTPTLVRQTRTENERDTEYGRADGSLAHARALRADGLSLRQVATLTGIPKSTLSDNL